MIPLKADSKSFSSFPKSGACTVDKYLWWTARSYGRGARPFVSRIRTRFKFLKIIVDKSGIFLQNFFINVFMKFAIRFQNHLQTAEEMTMQFWIEFQKSPSLYEIYCLESIIMSNDEETLYQWAIFQFWLPFGSHVSQTNAISFRPTTIDSISVIMIFAKAFVISSHHVSILGAALRSFDITWMF